MGWWFGRKAAPADVRPFVPAWLSGTADEGFARSYDSQFDEVYPAQPGRAAGGAAGRGDARRRCRFLPRRAMRGRRRWSSADGLLEGDRGESAAARQCLCAAARPATTRRRPSCACCGPSGSASSPTSMAGRSPICIARRGGRCGSRAATRLGGGRSRICKSLHPRDDHYGLGCLDAAIGGGERAQSRGRWNKALLDNAARPSGALVYEPARRSDAVGGAVSAAARGAGRGVCRQRQCRAAAAARGRAEVAGAEPDAGGHGFRRVEGGAARDIALAFGVPPVLVGLPGDATYANAREAGRALYRQTILPMAERILAGCQRDAGRLAGAGAPGGRHRPDHRACRGPGASCGRKSVRRPS